MSTRPRWNMEVGGVGHRDRVLRFRGLIVFYLFTQKVSLFSLLGWLSVCCLSVAMHLRSEGGDQFA